MVWIFPLTSDSAGLGLPERLPLHVVLDVAGGDGVAEGKWAAHSVVVNRDGELEGGVQGVLMGL